ncbi:Uncharacterised protein [Bordetella pertussis]|nr:Uncharacterised protein [Bordetella pertussis]CFV97997.1 Uncharacterised protein [Bordetella pertussis]CFW42877.1 Uncharacterised protein [Bordetella pertussis]
MLAVSTSSFKAGLAVSAPSACVPRRCSHCQVSAKVRGIWSMLTRCGIRATRTPSARMWPCSCASSACWAGAGIGPVGIV